MRGTTGWFVGSMLTVVGLLCIAVLLSPRGGNLLDVLGGLCFIAAGLLALPPTRVLAEQHLFVSALSFDKLVRWLFLLSAAGSLAVLFAPKL